MSQGSTSNIIRGTYSGSVSKPVKVDESGSLFTIPNQKLSEGNSTTTPLSASQSYTGSAEFNTYPNVILPLLYFSIFPTMAQIGMYFL
jgi:hypothetical protein